MCLFYTHRLTGHVVARKIFTIKATYAYKVLPTQTKIGRLAHVGNGRVSKGHPRPYPKSVGPSVP